MIGLLHFYMNLVQLETHSIWINLLGIQTKKVDEREKSNYLC